MTGEVSEVGAGLVDEIAAARCRDIHAQRWDLKYGVGTCRACLSWGGTFAPDIQAHTDAAVAAALEGAAEEVTEDGGAFDVLALYVDEHAHPYALDGIRRWLRDRAARVRAQVPTTGGGAER